MKVFIKIIWLLAVLLLFPGSLWGPDNVSPAALLMEAVGATAEPWGNPAPQAESEVVLETEPETTAAGEGAVLVNEGEGVAAVVDNLPSNGEAARAQITPETETRAAEVLSQTPVKAAYARYTKKQLFDMSFLLSNIFCVDSTTSADGLDWNVEHFLAEDFSLEKKPEPQILIFHTHSQETYKDSTPGDSSMTVQGVGTELTRILQDKYGYQVLHNTTTFDMQGGELDRSKAYTYAQNWLDDILEKYPSIEVVIDLHRDSVGENTHLVTEINGKPTAQVMLFNGLSQNTRGKIDRLYNPYLHENLAFSFQLKMLGDSQYPDFFRRIYLKGYRYNLHYRPRSLLLEVGAENNTFEEAVNAMEILAEELDQVLNPG